MNTNADNPDESSTYRALSRVRELVGQIRDLIDELLGGDDGWLSGVPAPPKQPSGGKGSSAAAQTDSKQSDSANENKTWLWRPPDDLCGDWGEQVVRGRDTGHLAELIRESEVDLTERQAQVVKMHLLEGLPVKEMARQLRLNASTVSEHLNKGRAVLENTRARLRDELRRAREEFLRAHPELLE